MSRPAKLLPLLAFMLVCSVVAAQAIDWSSPTYPFYGAEGTGPIYFSSSFEATNGSVTGGLLRFTGFNYASSGDFGTWGIGAEAGVSTTLLEMAPGNYILMQTSGATAKNVTLWFPDLYVVNCTNAAAWGWDNTTKLLEIQSPAGGAQIRISFIAGGTTTIFIIPQWFIDQGGIFFGITGFFTSLMSVMTAFVYWFASAIANVVSIIYYIMTMVMFLAGSVIYWFGAFVSFFIQLFTIMGQIWDGTSSVGTGLSDIVGIFDVPAILSVIPIFGFLWYYDALGPRIKKSGRNFFEVITGDMQLVMYWVGWVWEWSWTVFNFVYGIVMQFVGLLWGLIP